MGIGGKHNLFIFHNSKFKFSLGKFVRVSNILKQIREGYTALSFWKKNDAESVSVERGCRLIG